MEEIDDLLGAAVLPLLREGLTADELAARLSGPGLAVDAARASDVLGALAARGLVRVTGVGGGGARYVSTTLGQRIGEGQLARRPELAVGLEELERLRTDLLATIAHELRTPLTALRTSVGLLLDPALHPTDDERLRLLSTIARSSDRMRRLVDDLLDLARFRAGKIPLERRRFDARGVARDVAAAIGPLAAAAEQSIAVDLPPTPLLVYADHRRIEQALLNLASNAQRFSPHGGEVRLRVGSQGEEVVWWVEDDGPGIGRDEQRRLFERFFVGRGDPSHGTGGVGLGLPTALAIAQAHGGTIEVESEPGRGSRFCLRLPAEPGDE